MLEILNVFVITIRVSLFQVLAALGKDYFESILPDIIRNCCHQRASVRDGHLTLFKVSINVIVVSLFLNIFNI